MDVQEVYNLHQHSRCCFILLESGRIYFNILSSITRVANGRRGYDGIKDQIIYNREKTKVLYCESPEFSEIELNEQLDVIRKNLKEDYIEINNLVDGLYKAFKKGKNNWNENDILLERAASDILHLLINGAVDNYSGLSIESLDTLHYVCIVPSEWDHEIREQMLQPMFIQSKLVQKEDSNDRVLFISDIESLFYEIQGDKNDRSRLCGENARIGQHRVISRLYNHIDNAVSIKLDLLETQYPVHKIDTALFYPRLLHSTSLYIANHDIKNKLNTFLKSKLFPNGNINARQDKRLQMIAEYIYNSICYRTVTSHNNFKFTSKEPWIKFKSKWMLNKSQSDYLKSLSKYDICINIGGSVLQAIKNLIKTHNKDFKSYLYYDNNLTYGPRFAWIQAILETCIDFLSAVNATEFRKPFSGEIQRYAILGASIYADDAIHQSDLHSNPCILPQKNLDSSPSLFLGSGPDAIVTIDISFKSTSISCSLLNDRGFIKNILDKCYSIASSLPPLNLFFEISDITTLIVNEKFIMLIDRYLTEDLSYISMNDYSFSENSKKLVLEFEDILYKTYSVEGTLISTQQSKYIKAFLLMYFVHLNRIISNSLSTRLNFDSIKTGFLIIMEKRLLKCLAGTKEDLSKLIFASGLIQKDDNFKKLRIATRGEGLLPIFQKQWNLELPVKSCFLLAQLHEDYVQLSLNQVVTIPDIEEKEQESIILEDEVISTQNIYNSLCSYVWISITENDNILQRCDIHLREKHRYQSQPFSLINKTQFTNSLKEFIITKIFKENMNTSLDTKEPVPVNNTCNCSVYLSIRDIIEISLKPALQEIASIISSSLVNNNLFGNYENVLHLFSMIHFNKSSQLGPILEDILNEEIIYLNDIKGIELNSLVIPRLFNQLLEPVVHQKSLVYKSFQVGDLHQISNENYGFGICSEYCEYSDSTVQDSISNGESTAIRDTVFICLKKGDIINNVGNLERVFYLNLTADYCKSDTELWLWKLKKLEGLDSNNKLSPNEDTDEFIERIYAGVKSYNFSKCLSSLPIIVSTKHKCYSSCLEISVRVVGQDPSSYGSSIEVGEPMLLARF